MPGLGGAYDGRYDYLYGGGGGGGGSGAGGGQSVGEQANAFASQKIETDLDMNDPNNRAWYEQVHKALATLFIKALTNPNGFIDGPGVHNMTGSQLMQSLQNLSVNLNDDYVQFGAHMQLNASYNGGTINIGVSQLDGHIMQFGGDEYLGRNYVLFHELGHGVSPGLSYVQNGGSSPEAFANTMGYSLAGFAGEAYPAALSDVGSSGWLPF